LEQQEKKNRNNKKKVRKDLFRRDVNSEKKVVTMEEKV
jgi:hypothetical protein